MTKRASYPELAHWLREQQSAERDIAAATQEAAKWLERARLAKRADNQTLVKAATEQMTNVRARHQKAKDRLYEAQMNLGRLRAAPKTIDGKQTQFAEELLLSFELMGIDVEEAQFEEELQKEAVKQRIQEMKSEAGIDEDVDALALLKTRLQYSEARTSEDNDASLASQPSASQPPASEPGEGSND